MMARIFVWLAVLALAALGVAGVVAGGADDSPGLQLIGVLLVGGAVVLGVRSRRGTRDTQDTMEQ